MTKVPLHIIKPFLRYCVVGVLGTLIDVGSLYIFIEYLSLPLLLAATCSFLLAVTNNFILNKTWTFTNKSKNLKKLYVKFLIVSSVGLGLTIVSMQVLVNFLGVWYVFAKIVTSFFTLIWNFLANKFWTFRLSAQGGFTIPKSFDYELSIIVPAYNEENRIRKTLVEICNFIDQEGIVAEIIVVSDGSTDGTGKLISTFMEQRAEIKYIDLGKNMGKGFAVKKGVEQSQGRLILFTDADNSTPIEEYKKLLLKMQADKANIAIGSRYLHDSDVRIKQPMYRVILGRMGNLLIRLVLIDGVKDTQCGFKLFEYKAAKDIFDLQKVKRFAFDIETLVVAENMGYTFAEVPVSWMNSPESRVRPIKDALRTLKDLLYIKLNLWSGRYSSD